MENLDRLLRQTSYRYEHIVRKDVDNLLQRKSNGNWRPWNITLVSDQGVRNLPGNQDEGSQLCLQSAVVVSDQVVLPIAIRIPRMYPREPLTVSFNCPDQLSGGLGRLVYISPQVTMCTKDKKRLDEVCNFIYYRHRLLASLLIKKQMLSAVSDCRVDMLRQIFGSSMVVPGEASDEDDYDNSDSEEDYDDDYDDAESDADDDVDVLNSADHRFKRGVTALHLAVECGRIDMVQLLLDHECKLSSRWFKNPTLVRSLLSGFNQMAWQGQTMLMSDVFCAGCRNEQKLMQTLAELTSKAAENGELEVLNMLLEAGAPVHGSVVSAATVENDVLMIEALLDADADVNFGVFGRAPIPVMVAARNGHVASLQTLIAAGANIYPMPREPSVLHWALDVETAKTLIAAGANLDARDSHGNTPLFDQRPDIARLLLMSGATIDAQNANGSTALHIAVRRRDGLTNLPILIDHGASFSVADHRGNNVLHLSILNPARRSSHLQLFLTNAKDIRSVMIAAAMRGKNNQGDTPLLLAVKKQVPPKDLLLLLSVSDRSIVNLADNDGNTALHLVVLNGDPVTVKRFLVFGADVNAKNKQGRTALHIAIEHDAVSIVKALLAATGADVNIKDNYGCSVLHLAADRGQNLILGFLLQSPLLRLNERDKNGQTALHRLVSSSSCSSDMVGRFLSAGSNIHVQDKQGRTAVHLAVANNMVDSLQALLQAGASVNVKDKKGRSPLHLALLLRLDDIVTILLEEPTLVVNDSDGTLLRLAVKNDADEAHVQQLLERGAAVNAIDAHGNTALHYASSDAIVSLLLMAGADCRVQNNKGQTALHIAIWKRRHIKLLMTAGKSIGGFIDAQDNKGQTVLHLAVRRKMKKVVIALLKAGADRHIVDKDGHVPSHYAHNLLVLKALKNLRR